MQPPKPASPKQTSKILPHIAMSLISADAVETIEVALSLRAMIQSKSVVFKRREMGEFNVCMQLTYRMGTTVSKEHSQPVRGNPRRGRFEQSARTLNYNHCPPPRIEPSQFEVRATTKRLGFDC